MSSSRTPTPGGEIPQTGPPMLAHLLKRRKTQFRLRRRSFNGPIIPAAPTAKFEAPAPSPTPPPPGSPPGPDSETLQREVARRRQAEKQLATATSEIQTLLAGHANAMQELDRLQAGAAASAKELEEARAFVARARADMDMQRRRLQKEKEELQRSAGEEILRQLFPALDNFSYALELSRTGNQDAASLAEGMEMIYRELTGTLTRAGLESIREPSVPFDPQIHDAVSAECDATRPNGEVLAVLRPGYRLRDKVLRPAMVKVNRLVAAEAAPKSMAVETPPAVAETEPVLGSDFDRDA